MCVTMNHLPYPLSCLPSHGFWSCHSCSLLSDLRASSGCHLCLFNCVFPKQSIHFAGYFCFLLTFSKALSVASSHLLFPKLSNPRRSAICCLPLTVVRPLSYLIRRLLTSAEHLRSSGQMSFHPLMLCLSSLSSPSCTRPSFLQYFLVSCFDLGFSCRST